MGPPLSGTEPETTTASPTAVVDVTLAFFAAKPSGGADFRRKRDGANASLPDAGNKFVKFVSNNDVTTVRR